VVEESLEPLKLKIEGLNPISEVQPKIGENYIKGGVQKLINMGRKKHGPIKIAYAALENNQSEIEIENEIAGAENDISCRVDTISNKLNSIKSTYLRTQDFNFIRWELSDI